MVNKGKGNDLHLEGLLRNKKIIVLMSGLFLLAYAFHKISQSSMLHEASRAPRNIICAGVRSSSYGIKPFPEPGKWHSSMVKMSSYFEGSSPCAIWIVGVVKNKTSCRLEFPAEGSAHENIIFSDFDKHESYLSFFDKSGVKVFLQVEPAHADVPVLIDLVLSRYKHHECVIGFGIDVEWNREAENPEWGVRVTDKQAEMWEKQVKSHDQKYRLFLKHWDRNWMPPRYRGDIVFVSDSQIFQNFEEMLDEFAEYWAAYFVPNTVFFQIGYPSDRFWWQKMENPPGEMGQAIAERVSQNCGIFWVDFTLREVVPEWEEQVLFGKAKESGFREGTNGK